MKMKPMLITAMMFWAVARISIATDFDIGRPEPSTPAVTTADLGQTVTPVPAQVIPPQIIPPMPPKSHYETVAAPPTTLKGASALQCMAVAVYHEARNQDIEGQMAVASVILERAMTVGRWANTVCGVIHPGAFSFMQTKYTFPKIYNLQAWALAVNLSEVILANGPMKELEGAQYYHTRDCHPDWDKAMDKVATIGDHIFYRDPNLAS